MEYSEAIDFLYTQLPMFQRVGAAAYKPGLDTSLRLSEAFGNPHRRFKPVHVGGTNGKGSTAHTLAAVLQKSGYKTGLYTSPHLVDFRERIRVDGKMIPREAVADFVERYRRMDTSYATRPSFFELTMVMAFEYFAREQVDVAVIEVGLGGRLDSTNIITPELSVITNISFDHTQFLGDTLPKIAAEKAGIIKPGIPVVIGEAEGEVRRVFERKAAEENVPILFAEDVRPYRTCRLGAEGIVYDGTPFGTVTGELTGDCQTRNAATILTALTVLKEEGWNVTDEAVREGFAHVCGLTGLMGRWMKLGESPLVVCDTGHNVGGWDYLSKQVASLPGRKHVVIGFVNDKDISHILDLMPRGADVSYNFTNASLQRALPAEQLARIAAEKGLKGSVCGSVAEAYAMALADAGPEDSVFIGGSTFVVADLLSSLK